MRTRLIEATQDTKDGPNWGKFMIGQMDEEFRHKSRIDPGRGLLRWGCGWHSPDMVWVMDLETKEGAVFHPGGNARADLRARQIWVCVMFEPFLAWLYAWAGIHGCLDFDKLPDVVELPYVRFDLYGYRRQGQAGLPRRPRLVKGDCPW